MRTRMIGMSLMIVTLCVLVATMALGDIDSGMVAHYMLDGDVQDASGNDRHGSIVGDVVFVADHEGRPACAAMLNGTNARIDIGPNVKPGFPFSIALWLRMHDNQYAGIFRNDGWDDGAFRYGAALQLSSNGKVTAYRFEGYSAPNNRVGYRSDAPIVESGVWHHLVAVFVGHRNTRLYCDGVMVPGAYDDGTGSGLAYSWRGGAIGHKIANAGPIYLNGDIDDVRIYNRALTDGEVAELHGAAEPEPCLDVANIAKISTIYGGFEGDIGAGDSFGVEVEGAVDIDGDGNAELLVGEPGDGSDAEGAVWVLSLSSNGTVAATYKIGRTSLWPACPLVANELFGSDIAVLGDIDGDGTTEIAVGAPGTDPPIVSGKGSVYILSLDSSMTVQSHVRISEGEGGFTGVLTDGGEFGYGVADVGDVDGDGVTDLAVGAIRDVGTQGAVYILFLNEDGTVRAPFTRIAEGSGGFPYMLAAGSFLGDSLAPLGDLDHDGVPDLMVGATDALNPGAGRLWALFLATDGHVDRATLVPAPATELADALDVEGTFGASVALLGDVNSDGWIEVVVGDSGSDTGGVNRGAFYLLSLSGAADVVGFRKMSSAMCFDNWLDNGDELGHGVGVIPDIDGDGLPEIAIGSPHDDDGGQDLGAVYVVSIPNSGFSVSSVRDGFVQRPSISLYQNSPNPFNPETNISFDLVRASDVELLVYDTAGAMVRRIVNQRLSAGAHVVRWDGRDEHGRSMPSGVYLYRLAVGGEWRARKAILLK